MVFWKKESNSVDALYVDLFADKSRIPSFDEWNRKLELADWKNVFFCKEFEPGKNNQKSDYFRSIGNGLFGREDWIDAMEFYSQSLCFAELGTNNVSFAYSNRAACFLKLERYDECLRDIELAEQANYPHMPKLMQRKATCERLMERISTERNEFQPTLSFNPNEEYPCMADVLEIRMNKHFGRHVIANRDIDVGQTVLVEKFTISLGCAPDRVQCYNCTRDVANFIACPTCTDVMFCGEECRSQNEVHQKFCGSTINRMPHDVRFAAESLLYGIVQFSDANEMMSFVEETLAKRGTQIPNAINDSRTKYGFVLSLKPTVDDINYDQVYMIFTGISDNSVVKSMFSSTRSQRFLMHLCAEHLSILKNNSFNICVANGIAKEKMGLVVSLFNHACAPNVFNYASVDSDVFVTTRPIKKGEQLFISYSLNGTAPTEFDFLCKCDKCEPNCKAADRSMMKSDQNFKFLTTVSKENYRSANVKEKCEQFLQEFGHLPWSEEMDLVLNIYTDCLFKLNSKLF